MTEVLARGDLVVRGQIREASNAVLLCTAAYRGREVTCVYKPVAGERPLWDFPDGTLAEREVAAYELSEATGWGLVPPTVLREGPYGPGMCQLWVGPALDADDADAGGTGAGETGAGHRDGSGGTAADGGTGGDADGDTGGGTGGDGAGAGGAAGDRGAEDGGDTADRAADDGAETGAGPGTEDGTALLALVEGDEPGPGWKAVGFAEVGEGRTALLVHADDARLRRLAVLDAVLNNADRKGGHLLPIGGRLYAIDHGVTFHVEDKLRTLLWGWAGEPLPVEATEALRRLSAGLAEGAPLAVRLGELITADEVAAVRERVERLLRTGRHPEPGGRWPAIPWPPL